MMSRLLSLAVACLAVAPALAARPPAVSAVAYHPKGKLVAFGLHGEVRLYDSQTGTVVRKIPDQGGRVTALAFSPVGDLLAVASGEPGKPGTVRFHPLSETGVAGGQGPTLTAHSDTVYALAFSPDGKTFASAGYDRVIHVYDVSRARQGTAELRHTLKDHSDTVYGLAFHPDGKLLASGSADRAVKVWDVATGTRLYTLGDPTDWVYAVAWSPDGKHLAAAGVDKSIRVWAAGRDGAKLAHAVFAHEAAVARIGYGPEGKVLYSAGEDRVVKAWDAAKMVEAKVFPPQAEAILAFAVRPDGKQLAIGLFDGTGLLLDPATGKVMAKPLPEKPVAPKPEKLTPAGATRGTTATITVTGKNLDWVKAVTANVPGATAEPRFITPESLELVVNIPAAAPAGVVQLTFVGEAGNAAPLSLAIDRYPQVAESGLTESARAAMTINLPATVVGAIDRAGDVDFFRFEAKAGQQIGVQVTAAEAGSKLDPVLVLTDAAGGVLAEGGGALGYTVPKARVYSVGIRDREFRGGADRTYRLHIGDVPVVTGVFPLGVQRGKTTSVHLEGVNLGPAAGQPVSVAVPADAATGSKVPLPLPGSGEQPVGNASVVVDEFPAVVVDPVTGAEIHVPGSADGILLKPGSAQVTRFAAKAGERLIVEVLARRAESPVDPVIEILDAAGKPVLLATLRATAKTFVTFRDHDSAGTGIRLDSWNELGIDDYLYVDGELVRILALPKGPDDDAQFYQVAGQRVGFLGTTPSHHAQGTPMYRVEIHPPGRTFPPNGLPVFTLFHRNDDGGPGYGKDSRLFFDPPADGVYQVRVTDARGAGGPTHAYRVTVRPPRPDFTVSFNPTTPAVWKGGAVSVSVTATRLDGFDGPIQVRLEGLPPGFHAPATFIEGDHTTTAFALAADPGATVATGTKLRLVATSTIGGKEVTHDATGGTPTAAEPGDIVTTTRQDAVVIRPGQETRLVVDVERRGDFKGRIPLEVRGLPHGVRVLNIGLNGILITERDTSREVVIYAEPWVRPMERPVVVLARSERKGTEHAARSVLLKVEK